MKRIVGVLTVLDGWVVGSYGFSSWLPVGRIKYQIEELERWQVDEIAIIDISRTSTGAPLESILAALESARPLTPILVGGGIATLAHASVALNGGADRVLLGSGALEDERLVSQISHVYGDQAVVLSVPLVRQEGLVWLEPKSGARHPIERLRAILKADWGGEVLVMDVAADGGLDTFNVSLTEELSNVIPSTPIMAFGGIRSADLVDSLLSHSSISAVCLGNVIHQRELCIRELKSQVNHPLREFMGPK